ncbi:tetratricopeptide repeat protein [Saccharicrinis aurantiacus]|uniref:tetratricopeptide repeat protein n=1 Tax=Saccharicrinis aurantiacus TaxID=1849719 RepID=UPI00094FE1ED|nr:tetratricopeptide repeat protein [Saccharicrinis aurantiacus]
MSKEKEYATEASMENVEHALSTTEQFIEDNQKTLTIIMFAIIIVVGGYWATKKLYIQPQENEAQNAMFFAQNYFEKDSFNLALNGDGMNQGFLDIAEGYSLTKSSKLAKYYAGVSYLNLGNFDEAIDYLEGFSCGDEVINAMGKGALADAYLEKGNTSKAISNYSSAAKIGNAVVAPAYLLKLGLVYEDAKEYNKALEAYTRIKTDFKASAEARSIDKYITRADLLSKK